MGTLETVPKWFSGPSGRVFGQNFNSTRLWIREVPVFVRRRVAGFRARRGVAARQDKKSAVWVVSPPSLSSPTITFPVAISQTPEHESDAHMPVVLDGPEKRAVSRRFTVRTEIRLDCPWRAAKLPKPTSSGRSTAGRAHLSWPPTLSTVAAGSVTPAGRIGGRDGRLETFFPAKNDGRLTQWHSQEM